MWDMKHIYRNILALSLQKKEEPQCPQNYVPSVIDTVAVRCDCDDYSKSTEAKDWS